MMKPYHITIESAYEGGKTTTRVLACPIDGQLAHELGTTKPSAQQVADHYAGEFCDSGSIHVQRGTDRGHVARRQMAQ